MIIEIENKGVPVVYNGNIYRVSVRYRHGGDEMLFFIHGLGCSKETFDEVWAIQDFRNFSILCFDLIGFGDSSKEKNFSYKMTEHTEICRLLLDGFNFKKIHIVAHSMGGVIGLLLSDFIIPKTASFINIEGNLFPSDCMVSRKISKKPINGFRSDIIREEGDLFTEKTKSILLWVEWIKKSSPIAFNRSAIDLVKTTDSMVLLKKFKAIPCPKCYIYGENNASFLPLEMLKGIPVIPVSRSGHFPMIDNPEEFYRDLVSFLKKA